MNEQTAIEAIQLAETHVLHSRAAMWSSGASCIADARKLLGRQEYALSVAWASRAIEYVSGVFHADAVALRQVAVANGVHAWRK